MDRTQESPARQTTVLLVVLVALYTFTTIVFFWQWVPHLHTALIGPPEDNMNDFWNSHYAAVGARYQSFFFTNLIRFPEGTPLYYQAFAYPKVFAIALLIRLVGTDLPTLIFLHNLSLLISFPLAAIGMFFLARHLTGSFEGALIGGFIFSFNPSHIEHLMHHVGVSSIELIPFFVLCYLLALERKSTLWLVGAIAFHALCALLHWYYLFYAAYFIVFHTVYDAIRSRALPRGWALFVPLACLVGVAAVLSPLLVPMIGAATDPSIHARARFHVADLVAYFAFPEFHFLSSLSAGIYWRLTGNVWESTIYLGLLNLGLVAWLCFRGEDKNRGLLLYAFSGMLLFCVLASGPWLFVLGHRTIPMPDMVLSNLPLLRGLRGSSRLIVFVYLFLAIIVAHAYALAWRHRQRVEVRWGMAVITVLIVLDFFPARTLAITPVSCSPGLAVIRDDPEQGFGVLNLPGGSQGLFLYTEANAYMLQQACHNRPIVQGNLARNVVMTLRDRLETRDLEVQRNQLIEAEVKYIVITKPAGDLYPWSADDAPSGQYLNTYAVIYDASDIVVLRVY